MLLRQKAYSIAEVRLRAAYEGRKKQLGMENADTIQAFTKLADVYLELQSWPKSLALLIEEYERLKKKFKKIQEDEGWCTFAEKGKIYRQRELTLPILLRAITLPGNADELTLAGIQCKTRLWKIANRQGEVLLFMKEYSECQRHFYEVFDDVKEVHKQWTSQHENEVNSDSGLTGTTASAMMTNMVSFGTTTNADIEAEMFSLLTRSQYNLARALHANHDLAKAEKYYKVALRNRAQRMCVPFVCRRSYSSSTTLTPPSCPDRSLSQSRKRPEASADVGCGPRPVHSLPRAGSRKRGNVLHSVQEDEKRLAGDVFARRQFSPCRVDKTVG